MKNRLFVPLFFFLCGIFGTTLAQNVDGGATEILTKLSKIYQNYSSMTINYTYTVEIDKKIVDSQQGKVVIKGNSYKMELKSQVIYCNGTTIWNYQTDSDEISIFDTDPEDEMSMMNPVAMLANWQKEYKAKFIREETKQNRILQIIDLQPIKLNSYYKIRLFVDKQKNEIYASSIYDKDNSIYSYYIDKFVVNVTYNENFFILDVSKYPNAEINDMR